MAQNAAGYELAANRLLNRARKMTNDSEQRAQAELLIATANTFALLDLANAIRGQQAGAEAASDVSADTDDDASAIAEDEAAEVGS